MKGRDLNAQYRRPASRRPRLDPRRQIHEYNYPLYRYPELPGYGVLRISMGSWVPLQLIRLADAAEEQAVPWLVRFGEIKAFGRQQDAWDWLCAQTGVQLRLEIG